jgi:hypothetical protein
MSGFDPFCEKCVKHVLILPTSEDTTKSDLIEKDVEEEGDCLECGNKTKHRVKNKLNH